jgi:hypothetical protein
MSEYALCQSRIERLPRFTQPPNTPVVRLASLLELDGAQRVRDVLHRVVEAVREVVCRVNAPCVAYKRVVAKSRAINDRGMVWDAQNKTAPRPTCMASPVQTAETNDAPRTHKAKPQNKQNTQRNAAGAVGLELNRIASNRTCPHMRVELDTVRHRVPHARVAARHVNLHADAHGPFGPLHARRGGAAD